MNIEKYRLDVGGTKKSKPKQKGGRKPFVMGLDVATLSDVFDGGIAATRVWCALAYVAGLTKSNRKLRLSRRELDMFGITPQAQNRGLGVLERKGLIEFVERKRGARPVVNVLI